LVVHAKLRPDLFELQDLISNKLLTVHISRMRSFHTAPETTCQLVVAQAGVVAEEVVVEAIIDHRGNPRARTKMEFLVHWAGYDSSEDEWLPWKDVRDLEALDKYSKEHPELKLG